MKVAVFFLFIALFFLVQAEENLMDAVKSKKIKLESEFVQLGEKGIVLRLTNLLSIKQTIIIRPGTLFEPESDEEQTLLNVEEQLLVIAPKETREIKVDGYCMMLHKLTPNRENNFKVNTLKIDSDLNALLAFFKENKVTKNNYQNAIWAITNHEDIGVINPETEGDIKLREYLATLTKNTNPWYYKNSTIAAIPGRTIERSSASIEGILTVKPKETIQTYLTIENENNEEIRKIDAVKLMKNATNEFKFSVRVENWKAGNYKIHIRNKANGNSIRMYEFKV